MTRTKLLLTKKSFSVKIEEISVDSNKFCRLFFLF